MNWDAIGAAMPGEPGWGIATDRVFLFFLVIYETSGCGRLLR